MKALARAAKEAVTGFSGLPASMGFDRGWRPIDGFGRPGSARAFANSMKAYGGTSESSGVVFACTTVIADTLAGYPWAVTNKRDKPVVESTANKDLFELLNGPTENGTYDEFAADVETDLCLIGNSWWLKDQMNLLGRPAVMSRLDPTTVKVKTNKRDQKIGYTVRIADVEIPFGLDDIIHFRLRNPLNKHYGMGIVEALFREMTQDIVTAGHLTAFFQNGARIAGVLTVPESMDDVQYARLKREVEEEYGDPHNAYGIVLAEKATNFTPVSAPMQHMQIVDLSKLTDDAILMGFGVPKFMLGGYEEGGVPKMEQSQYIFHRRMVPRATRYQNRLTLDLVSRWDGNKFAVYPDPNEPPGIKIENAQGLAKAGASLNETRVAAGLPVIDDEKMDIPLVPTSVVPIKLLFQKPAQPRPALPRGDKPDDDNGDDERALGTGYEHELAEWLEGVRAPRPDRGFRSDHRPAPKPIGGGGLQLEERASSTNGGDNPRQLVRGSLSEAVDDSMVMIDSPLLPVGYEQRAPLIDPGSVDPHTAQSILHGQADFFVVATAQVHVAFIDFFNKQQLRVSNRIATGDFRSNGGRAKGRSRGGAQSEKKPLEPGDIWDTLDETQELIKTYLEVVDRLGPKAIEVPSMSANVTLTWDTENPFISAARDRLGAQIVGINDTTRTQLAAEIDEGMRRGYTLHQIQLGRPDENYRGIQGVFADATAARAETIARTETAMMYGGATAAATRAAGWESVAIIDGIGDAGCADANGAIWPIDEYEANLIEHPNCVRAGVPMSPDDVEANGGNDA